MAEQQAIPQLIVVGSSAGGIEALSTLVSSLPGDLPVPIVVAQHLDPRRQSHLADILSRRTSLEVVTVERRERLRPGVLYLVPANRLVEVTGDAVTVREAPERGPKPSVDLLLNSAADAFGEGLVAVILTGSGSDGTAGARRVSAAGGTVVIQNPKTASYPSMPQSLAPTTVDVVADIGAIGPLLRDLVSGVHARRLPEEGENALGSFLAELQQQTGIDFEAYKRPTILRRLERRMAATSTSDLNGYVRYLRKHPDEYQRLASSFLIKVTGFFRDPELFDHLRENVLPRLVADAEKRGGELRFWSAGCATGEEAYSLAILVAEVLGERAREFSVRVFATDLDAEAIAFARRGVYAPTALENVPKPIIERYFNKLGDVYEIKKQIRLVTVFGEHDLARRAPFPRIDLTLCRNVLIYFTAELQRRALQLFAFSLRDGGVLVLGKSETTSPLPELFVLENSKLKVYRREGERVVVPPAQIRPARTLQLSGRTWGGGRDDVAGSPPSARSMSPSEKAEKLLLRVPVGIVVVDGSYDIQFINEEARRLLGIHVPAIAGDFVHLAASIDSELLRKLLHGALRGSSRQMLVALEADAASAERRRWLELRAMPASSEPSDGDGSTGAVLLISDVSEAVEERQRLEQESSSAQAQLRLAGERVDVLGARQADLLSANQDLIVLNAELRSTNEELLIANEEVQAATEEVETLNEELQATNEELETLNEELQATVEELNTTNDDLESRGQELQEAAITLGQQQRLSDTERARLSTVLAHMADGVVVIGPDGEQLLSNEAYDLMLGSLDVTQDATDSGGQPLAPERSPQALAVAGEQFALDFTVTGEHGQRRWFEALGGPLGEPGGREGGVVVVRDITDRQLRRLQEEFMAVASHELRTPLAALRGYLQLLLLSPEPQPSDEVRRQVTSALLQTNRLVRLTTELLDATRLEHGRLDLSPERIDIGAAVRRAVEIAQVLAPDQPILLAAPSRPLMVEADETRLEQAVLNVIVNGQQHAAESPSIDVSVRRVGTRAAVRVADAGPGIPAEAQAHAFERFSRVADRRSAPSAGLGLGLYITKAIIDAHGGDIAIDSRSGEGTRITIRVPLAAQPAAMDGSGSGVSLDSGGRSARRSREGGDGSGDGRLPSSSHARGTVSAPATASRQRRTR